MVFRARVKLLLEMSAEDPTAVIESFGTQVMQEDVLPLTTRDFAALVDSVTTDDVNQVCELFSLLLTASLQSAARNLEQVIRDGVLEAVALTSRRLEAGNCRPWP